MIKIAYSGDGHGNHKTPKNRMDDYFSAFCKKFSYMIDYCLDEHVGYIIHAGDLFDHHSVKYAVTNFLLKELKRWESFAGARKFLTITGQHDVRYHSHFDDTPYESLLNSGLIQHLGAEPFPIIDAYYPETPEVHVYGASFEQDVPEILNEDAYNILVVHKMIVQDKLWEGQEDYTPALGFLRSHKFNLIVAGDNHSPFTIQHRSKTLTMCGSMMRKSIDQKDYEPKFYVTYIPNNTHESVYFPIEPDVFKEEEVEIGKERKVMVEKFAEGLKDSNLVGLKFADRIKKAIEINEDIEPHVAETINDIMETVDGRSN
jgi:DNA repair exonuclease SbcCD nuclease subunit